MFQKFIRTLLLLALAAFLAVCQPLQLSAMPSAAHAHTFINNQNAALPAPDAGESIPNSPGTPSAPLASIGKAAFALELYPGAETHYIPDAGKPGEWMHVGSLTGKAYYAGDFVGRDYSQLYVLDYALEELHTVDTATGATATIGTCAPLSGHVWTGATGTANGILYASSTNDVISYLYRINTSTGAVTPVGQITNAVTIIDIAINADNQMYGVDIENDTLVRINRFTGAGTVRGPIGFDADFAQGLDFEEASGVLYLAAYNTDTSQGELRTANTSTGSTSLVGAFPGGAEVTVLAFTPPPVQRLQNPGFESGWAGWYTQDGPILSGSSHTGSLSAMMSGETCWVWQPMTIPPDALELTLSYWVTGVSSDDDPDNDIFCASIWDLTFQTEIVDACYGMFYFYSYPMTWRHRQYRLTPAEVSAVAGQTVQVAFYLTQDWNPGYHKTSTAYVDDTALDVTRPLYDFAVYLPMAVR
jgi:hypothetical protein